MESSPSTLVIRADAGVQIGTGHVMRCLALAQSWQDAAGRVIFALADPPASIEARLRAESCQIERVAATPGSRADADEVAALAGRMGAEWLVLDGYHFDGAYQRRIKDAGLQLVGLDDYGHATNYAADLVVNQNIDANESLYRQRQPYTRLLLGTRYTLLRREFLRWRDWRRTNRDGTVKLLVTLGGSDPDNITLQVIHAIEQMSVDELEVVVLVGASNPHVNALQSAIDSSQKMIRLIPNATKIPELMAWADVAITAGGSTVWEALYMGLPAILVPIAANQENVSTVLAERGLAKVFWAGREDDDLHDILSECVRDRAGWAARGQQGRQVVDGRGSERVLEAMRDSKHQLDHP